MKIIKRSGVEEEFHLSKIEAAIVKANDTVLENERLTKEQIQEICTDIESVCGSMGRAPSVEEIQEITLP